MTLIDKHGQSDVAVGTGAHFGGAYEDFLAGMGNKINDPVSSQKVALAIPVTNVAAGDTANIVLSPQVDFKGEILIVSDSGAALGNAGYFLIESIKVGRDEQLVASSGVPAQVFAQGTTQPIGLNMKVCPTSLNITLSVTNLDAGNAHNFSGVLIGSCGGCNETRQPAPDTGASYDPLVALAIPLQVGIAKGDTVTIPITVEVPFTGQRVVIPTSLYDSSQKVPTLADTSSFFTIDSIKIGRDEMLTSSDPIPASVFAINSPREVGLSMKKCPTSLTINVTVTNADQDAHDFAGAFYGFCGESGVCNSGWCTDCDIGTAAAAPAMAAVARAAQVAAVR